MKHLLRFILSLILSVMPLVSLSEPINFTLKKNAAGRASLTSHAFYNDIVLGSARFSPELAMPIQLFYDSSVKEEGLLGAGWKVPQLESSVLFEKDKGILWTAPWGEQIFFYERKKVDKESLKMVNEDKSKDKYVAPLSDWSLTGREETGTWTFTGKKEKTGWIMQYYRGQLMQITAPSGQSLQYIYENSLLREIRQLDQPFVTLQYSDNFELKEISINGVKFNFEFKDGQIQVLPDTLAGKEQILSVRFLGAIKQETLNPLEFTYSDTGFLNTIKRGDFEEKLIVQEETEAERKAWLQLKADCAQEKKPLPKDSVEKFAGRLLSDGSFNYKYIHNGFKEIGLINNKNETAYYLYDSGAGLFRVKDFGGREINTYFYMRYDVSYNGKTRQIVDGKGMALMSYRYDNATGKVSVQRDAQRNEVHYSYNEAGQLSELARKGSEDVRPVPIKRFEYKNSTQPTSIHLINEKGDIAQTTTIRYNKEERPVSMDDGRGETKIAYNAFGYPTQYTDKYGQTTRLTYDAYNRLIAVKNPNGAHGTAQYNALGQMTRSLTMMDKDILSAQEISYDANGQPIAFKNEMGREKKVERDAKGRIVKEVLPDDSAVSYAYDTLGRLQKVIDQNGNPIEFAWNAFGLAEHSTAEGQVTKNIYDASGRVVETQSSQGSKTDKAVKYEYDAYNRLVSTNYGADQKEIYSYDSFGRLIEKFKGGKTAQYKYDHFGRIAEIVEGAQKTLMSYDVYGNRLSRITQLPGKVLEEHNTYDKFGRLTKKVANGKTVEYKYDDKNRLMEQIANGVRMTYEYTPLGQLSRKTLWDTNGKTLASLNYIHGKDGKIMGRTVNGKSQHFQYDRRNQLVAVLDGESKEILERYNYDPAGNILKKTVLGKTTSYTYDRANQLVQSIANNGQTTDYAYDAAGRMIKEGAKSYTYGYMDKVMSVFENGQELASFEYDQLGQISKVIRPGGEENFVWDGLALIARNGIDYVNERHVGGGSPILAGNKLYFNDLLASTQGEVAQNDQNETTYIKHNKSSFGTAQGDTEQEDGMFTGKPYIKELGYAFWGRNYRPDLGKWMTADPLGYPDGTNNFAYCNNNTANSVDLLGLIAVCTLDDNSGKIAMNFESLSHGVAEPGYAGYFDIFKNCVYTKVGASNVLIAIRVGLYVKNDLKPDSQFKSGDTAYYMPHTTDGGGGSGTEMYEEVLAHEKGHFEGYLAYVVPLFLSRLASINFNESLELKEFAETYHSQITSIFLSVLKETEVDCLLKANEYIEQAYQSWKRLPNGDDGSWHWIKE